MRRTLTLWILLLLGFAAGVDAQRGTSSPGPGAYGDKHWRPPVQTYGQLPPTGNRTGDTRTVWGGDAPGLYVWTGAAWEATVGDVGASPWVPERVVNVDSSLPTDGAVRRYASIKEAADFVAGQSGRSDSSQWLVLVYPGRGHDNAADEDWSGTYNYLESPLTVPTWTSVQGVAAGHNNTVAWTSAPLVQLTAGSGALVTLQPNASLVNLALFYNGTPVAPVSIVRAAEGGVSIVENVSIRSLQYSDEQPVVGFEVAGGLYTYDTSVLISGLVAVGSRAAKVTAEDSTLGLAVYGGRWGADGGTCHSLFEAASPGRLKVFWARIDGGCQYDFERSGAGTPETVGTPWSSALGDVTTEALRGRSLTVDGPCRITSGTGNPNGAVPGTVCDIFLRRDGGAGEVLCVKESGSSGSTSGWSCK